MFERLKKFAYRIRSAVSTLANPERWLIEMFGGTHSKSGTRVNENTAVKVTAVFACVRLLAQTLASLPLHTYKRVGDGRERAYDHPLYSLLHSLANPECTSYNFRLIMMVNLLLTGNAYAEIVRNGAGHITELWPISSSRVNIRRNFATNEIFYDVYTLDGKLRTLYPEKMFHLQWIGTENFDSFKPVALAREAIGLSIATEEFGSRFFSNGANASGIAEYPGKLSEDAHNRFEKTFNEKYVGISKNQRVLFLEEGLKFTKLTVNPNEAQAVETREFQVVEIARFYNVPLHLIQENTKSTSWGTGIEEMNIGFVTFSMRPYLVCWEQEMIKSLFLPSERRTYFSEFNVDGLLRGDSKSRAEALDIKMRNGVINADEWRAMDNMNPQPNGIGKKYYRPLNWIVKGEDDSPPDNNPTRQNASDNRQSKELMQKRAAQENVAQIKSRTANAYKRMFQDASLRIVRREKSQVLDKAKKTLASRGQADFDIWLDEYYRDAPGWMQKTIMPTVMSYTEAIQGICAEEVNAKQGMTPELEKYAEGYAVIWAREYADFSATQIKDVMRKANESGEDALEAIEARLDEWEERRPEKVSRNEIIAAAGIIGKFVYRGAGVRRLRWITAGSKTCPYCNELSGRVVGIDQAFVAKDDRLDTEDGQMEIRKPALTPPLHGGCMCMVVAD